MSIIYADVERVEDTVANLPAILRNKMVGFETNGTHRQMRKYASGVPKHWTPDEDFDATIPAYANAIFPAVDNVSEMLDALATASITPLSVVPTQVLYGGADGTIAQSSGFTWAEEYTWTALRLVSSYNKYAAFGITDFEGASINLQTSSGARGTISANDGTDLDIETQNADLNIDTVGTSGDISIHHYSNLELSLDATNGFRVNTYSGSNTVFQAGSLSGSHKMGFFGVTPAIRPVVNTLGDLFTGLGSLGIINNQALTSGYIPTTYTNLTSSCDATGWSTFNYQQVSIIRVGQQVTCSFYIGGDRDTGSNVASFELPFGNAGSQVHIPILISLDGSTFTSSIAYVDNDPNYTNRYIVACYQTITSPNWPMTAGKKIVIGQFTYFTDE